MLLGLSACGPSPEQADTLGRYLMESLVYARETADTLMMEDLFLPDATYDDYPSQLQYQGIQDIVGFLTSVHEWGDDVYLTLGNVRAGPSTAVGEWYLAAVQSRPIPSVIESGTGRDVSINGITLLEIEGGRIARAADYWDNASFLLQLGGRIELPDGTVLTGPETPN
jgi:hypothetical protein